jgi:hypothetical protein
MAASLCISSVETQKLDSLFDARRVIGSATTSKPLPHAIDDDRHLHDIDPALVESTMASTLAERASLGQFCASIGATTAHLDATLFPNLVEDDINMMDHTCSAVLKSPPHVVSLLNISRRFGE